MLSKLVVAALLLASLPGLTRNKTAAITQTASADVATPPPVKMGLWESTITNSVAQKPLKARFCMTPQSYQESMAHVPAGCTISNKKQTATSITGDVSCNLQHGGTTTGHIEVEMPDTSTIRSTVSLTINAQGQTVPMTLTTESHYVAADCGAIVPGQAKIIQ